MKPLAMVEESVSGYTWAVLVGERAITVDGDPEISRRHAEHVNTEYRARVRAELEAFREKAAKLFCRHCENGSEAKGGWDKEGEYRHWSGLGVAGEWVICQASKIRSLSLDEFLDREDSSKKGG